MCEKRVAAVFFDGGYSSENGMSLIDIFYFKDSNKRNIYIL